MGKFGKILKAGMMGGLAGAAAKAGGVGMNGIARNGGFGLLGMTLARKKAAEEEAMGRMRRAGMDVPATPAAGGMRSSMQDEQGFKKGGKVKKMAKGGSTASKRADGCATKGKTKGRFV